MKRVSIKAGSVVAIMVILPLVVLGVITLMFFARYEWAIQAYIWMLGLMPDEYWEVGFILLSELLALFAVIVIGGSILALVLDGISYLRRRFLSSTR